MRLEDNPCLLTIQKSKQPALFVYIYDDIESKAIGEAGHWWLHESLKKLEFSYTSKFKAQLIIKKGNADKILDELIKKYKITHVLWNRLYFWMPALEVPLSGARLQPRPLGCR